MRSAIPLPDPAALDAEGRAIYDSILASRGNLDGPFLAWLHSPGFADPAQQLGKFCRYDTQLSTLQSELLILIVAAHFQSAGEWAIHAPIAIAAGLHREAVDAIAAGDEPQGLDQDAALLAQCARTLLRTNALPAALRDRAVARFGIPTLVEAVGLVGYYSLVAMTLNAFDMTVSPEENDR